jgi:hypothetical protein
MAAKLKIKKRGDEILSSFRGEDFFLISYPFFLICIIGQNRQKFIKNPVTHAEKLIIMLIQFKFGHILA